MRSTVTARHLRGLALIGQRDVFVRSIPRPEPITRPVRGTGTLTGSRVTGSPGVTAPMGTTEQLLWKRGSEVVCDRCWQTKALVSGACGCSE